MTLISDYSSRHGIHLAIISKGNLLTIKFANQKLLPHIRAGWEGDAEDVIKKELKRLGVVHVTDISPLLQLTRYSFEHKKSFGGDYVVQVTLSDISDIGKIGKWVDYTKGPDFPRTPRSTVYRDVTNFLFDALPKEAE